MYLFCSVHLRSMGDWVCYCFKMDYISSSDGNARASKIHFKCSASCSNSTLLLEFEAINQ